MNTIPIEVPQALPRPPVYLRWTAVATLVLVAIAIAGTITFPHS